MKRNCDNTHCGKEYEVDMRNFNRGWGRCCSKSCAAKVREMSKPGYDPKRVAINNVRRVNWNKPRSLAAMSDSQKAKYNDINFGEQAPNIVGTSGIISGYTSEEYRIMDGVAYDEFDEPMYDVGIGEYDEGDSEYYNNKDY